MNREVCKIRASRFLLFRIKLKSMLILFIKNEYHAKNRGRSSLSQGSSMTGRNFFSLSPDVFYVKIF